MLGRELEIRANKLVKESKERAEKAKRQAEKERILRQRQEDRQRQLDEQKRQQRIAEEAAAEAVSLASTACFLNLVSARVTPERAAPCRSA